MRRPREFCRSCSWIRGYRAAASVERATDLNRSINYTRVHLTVDSVAFSLQIHGVCKPMDITECTPLLKAECHLVSLFIRIRNQLWVFNIYHLPSACGGRECSPRHLTFAWLVISHKGVKEIVPSLSIQTTAETVYQGVFCTTCLPSTRLFFPPLNVFTDLVVYELGSVWLSVLCGGYKILRINTAYTHAIHKMK